MRKYNAPHNTARRFVWYTLAYRIAMINPKQEKIYIPGIGKIENEWTFCDNIFELVTIACVGGMPLNDFVKPLLIYIRYKESKKVNI